MSEHIVQARNPMIATMKDGKPAISIYYAVGLDFPKELVTLANKIKKDEIGDDYGVDIRIPVADILESTIHGAEHGAGSNLLSANMKPGMEALRDELLRLIARIETIQYK